jgi:ATP-dependent DNA helicase RecG
VVVPVIEDLENKKAFLQAIYPTITIEIVHGKMKKEERAAIMSRFFKKEISILVSTSIVQIGIDTPNANTMIV